MITEGYFLSDPHNHLSLGNPLEPSIFIRITSDTVRYGFTKVQH